MPLNFDGEEEDMKEGLKPWGERMKWPLNSGVGYAGICSQYAGEGTERRDWRLKRTFMKEFVHFKLWGSAQAVKQVFGWLLRFFICCGFFGLVFCQSSKSMYSNLMIYSHFCFIFSQTWFPCKRACFPQVFLIKVPV